jgi:parallel beta-helix repeat protein
MKLKAVSGIMLTLLLIGMLTLAFNIQLVKASGTIYLRADGSIDPPTANITTVDNVTYTFTGNVNDSIVVERDNIVVDGAGYLLQGTQAYDSRGINLSGRSNITIKNMAIKAFYYGIWLGYSFDNSIIGNNITNNNWYGIMLEYSSNNTISWNNIAANQEGIRLYRSSNNLLHGNTIKNNGDGLVFWISCSNNRIYQSNIANNTHCNVWIQESSENVIAGNNIVDSEWGIGFDHSPNNKVYHNHFAANDRQVVFINTRINIWDNGYPSGGNYWSNYTGVDEKSGPYQNVTGSDGIGDTSHVIDGNNTDNYPLMQPYHGSVRNLNTGESYPTIQEAINNATEGDRIFALSGTYYEHVVVNKTVSLIGENKGTTIIDGNGTGTVVHVTGNNTFVSGFTIRNSGPSSPDSGIRLDHSGGNNISHNTITNNVWGISLYYSNDNTISGNNASSNRWIGIVLEDSSSNNMLSGNILSSNPQSGIWFDKSNNNTLVDNIASSNNNYGIVLGYNCSYNTFSGNIISNNRDGIMLQYYCSHNMLSGNTISNNYRYGIILSLFSDNNILVHNNFINNTNQFDVADEHSNIWDDGYPSGGNFWSDHVCVGNPSDGSQPYIVDADNIDHYPFQDPNGWLLPPVHVFEVVWDSQVFYVSVESNSTVSNFYFNHAMKEIGFNVTGPDGTIGFCNVTIPKTLLLSYPIEQWIVLIDGQLPLYFIATENETHTMLYFTYSHTTHQVQIFGTWVIGPPPTPPVGGKANPIDSQMINLELQIPWIWLTTIILPLLATVVYVKFKKKKQ